MDDAARERDHDPRTGSLDSLSLVARARGGDRDALDALCARYYERVLRIVRARTGELLARVEAPEDLVQDTFVEAVRSFDRFEPRHDASLILWFASLAENRVRNAARHHQRARRDRRREVPLELPAREAETNDALAEPAASSTAVPDRLAQEEHERILDACIAELRPEQREAILLRDYAGGSWDWIADALGRQTPAAARELHRRARANLMLIARRRLRL